MHSRRQKTYLNGVQLSNRTKGEHPLSIRSPVSRIIYLAPGYVVGPFRTSSCRYVTSNGVTNNISGIVATGESKTTDLVRGM